jgi:predicted ATP-dependent serine protease
MPEPTAVLTLVRASGGGRRTAQRNLTPLVGRDEAIAVLMRRWGRTRTGDGQLVLIVGEPGLGKSRQIEEFHVRASAHHRCLISVGSQETHKVKHRASVSFFRKAELSTVRNLATIKAA